MTALVTGSDLVVRLLRAGGHPTSVASVLLGLQAKGLSRRDAESAVGLSVILGRAHRLRLDTGEPALELTAREQLTDRSAA